MLSRVPQPVVDQCGRVVAVPVMASLAGLPPDVARVLQEAARRAERHAVLDSAMTQMQRLLNIPVAPEMLPWGSAMSQSKAYFFRTWISTTIIICQLMCAGDQECVGTIPY